MGSGDPSAPMHGAAPQTRHYERQAQKLLQDALRQLDAHVGAAADGSLHDKRRWKQLKRHEALTVFKELHAPHMTADASSSTAQSVALAGSVPGSLADVLYGLVTPDTPELRLRSRLMPDADALDDTVIEALQLPSPDEPFRFLALQWSARAAPARYKALARQPRDFVYLVASGVVQREVDGDLRQVGYYLRQSVERPAYSPLPPHSCTRGWLATCALFVQTEAGQQVEVFARGRADFHGKMAASQAATMAANLLLADVADAAVCGQNKKLRWQLQHPDSPEALAATSATCKPEAFHCGICARRFGVVSSVGTCMLCRVPMCSRCRLERDLSFVERVTRNTRQFTGGTEVLGDCHLRSMHAVLCKNCLVHAGQQDARAIARQEVESGRFRPSATLPEAVGVALDMTSNVHVWQPPGSQDPDRVQRILREGTTRRPEAPRTPDASTPVVLLAEVDQELMSLRGDDRTRQWPANAPNPRPVHPSSAGDAVVTGVSDVNRARTTQQRMWSKMAELRMTAESVYQFTSQLGPDARAHPVPLRVASTASSTDSNPTASFLELD